MTKIDIVKLAARIIVGVGTGKIAKDVIVSNTHTPVTKIDKITMTASALVIGAIASDATDSYTDRKIDEIVNIFKDAKIKIDEAKS